ncbi:MAG: AAA family ATPase [Thermocladium sp.]|jgi:MoxR-like ATPases|nr:MAG: ATPase [Thermocladium sp. ECH_B]
MQNINESIIRIKNINEKLNDMFYKYSDEISGILISVLSRENFLLVGPPGTAKTTLVYTLSKLTNIKWFYRQLTKFTDLEEILGPIDIAKLLEGKVERIYANSIIESELALLDEIFNASSAILNTLLSLLNERVVYDGDKIIPVKTWAVFGSSNRVPDEEELQALFDRFPLRTFTEYVLPEDTENLLIKGWNLRREMDELRPLASMDDIRALNQMQVNYLFSNTKDISKILSPVIADYVEHIPISNRTRIKIPLYAYSLLLIQGFKPEEVTPMMLKVAAIRVAKYLVQNKDQLSEYEAFAMTHMPEELLKINDLISEAKALLSNNIIDDARTRLMDARETMSSIRTKWDKSLYSLYKYEIDEMMSTIEKLEEMIMNEQ